jgi:hypothetical protein
METLRVRSLANNDWARLHRALLDVWQGDTAKAVAELQPVAASTRTPAARRQAAAILARLR